MYANSFNNNSTEEIKKNIVYFDDEAIKIIKNSKIYEFNYKKEKDNEKKHIGFVIGDKYETPRQIIDENNQGIDMYSMTSILWKAIQEQQEQIEELQRKIKELEDK